MLNRRLVLGVAAVLSVAAGTLMFEPACGHAALERQSASWGESRGGPFLGLTPPGTIPILFAPGLVSTGLAERDVAISPDGREFYFGVTFRSIATIMVTRLLNGRWTPPQVASFAADAVYFHMEPCLSHDGRRVFFLTNRPRAGEAPKAGWASQNIWAADRMADGTWSEPYDLGAPINVESANFFPSITRDGTLYFTRAQTSGQGAAIYRARSAGKGFAAPERLPEAVNGYAATFNGFIAPDESYLVAGVEGRQESSPAGKSNYYVFFHQADGTWTSGANLGPTINDATNTVVSPYVSPDGRYFFFASTAQRERRGASLRGLTLQHLVDLSGSPQNGNSDIYWVSASVIGALRPAGM